MLNANLRPTLSFQRQSTFLNAVNKYRLQYRHTLNFNVSRHKWQNGKNLSQRVEKVNGRCWTKRDGGVNRVNALSSFWLRLFT